MSEMIAVVLSAILLFGSGLLVFKKRTLFPCRDELEFFPLSILIRILDVMAIVVFVIALVYFSISVLLLIIRIL